MNETAALIFKAVGIIVVFTIIFTFPVMWLWNWLCPDLFGLPAITFWQAWGLSALFKFIMPMNTGSST